MALGDLLSMLAMPQNQGISTLSGYNPAGPDQQAPVSAPTPQGPVVSPPGTAPDGSLMPDPQMLLGHHINNLLQVTGNLQPPSGVQGTTDQTQANIPGGYHTPDPVNDPTGGDPHYYSKHVNGPFKTHGVVGDILGHVMDAVLVGAGLHPEYTQRAQAAKQADAINGYQNDPTGALMKLTATAGAPAATAFQTGVDADVTAHNAETNRQAQLAITAATADLAKKKAIATSHVQQANLAGTLTGLDPKDPATIAKAKFISDQIQKARNGYGDTEPVPTDVAGLQDFANSSITPEQRLVAGNTKNYRDAVIAEQHARAGIAQQNADTSASRAGISSRNADIHAASVANTNRHNLVTEGQGAARVQQAGTRVAQTQQRIDNALPPPPQFEGQTASKGGKVIHTAVKVNGQLVWH